MHRKTTHGPELLTFLGCREIIGISDDKRATRLDRLSVIFRAPQANLFDVTDAKGELDRRISIKLDAQGPVTCL